VRGGEKAGGEVEGRQVQPERDPSEKPNPKDFDDYEQYLDARDQHNRSQWQREQERTRHAETTVSQIKAHLDAARQAMTPEVYEAISPDLLQIEPYFALSEGAPLTVDNLIMGEVVYAREKGPAVLKHLSEHPEELQRLRALRTHPDIRVEVRYLAKTLGSTPDAIAGDPPGDGERPPKAATSKAAPPFRPVSGAPHIADGDESPRENEDFDAWHRRTSKRAAAAQR
jgi:hypothetical protein